MSKVPSVGGFVITGSGADIARLMGAKPRNPEAALLNKVRANFRLHNTSTVIATKLFPKSEAMREREAGKRATLRAETREAVKMIRAMRAG